MKKSPVVFFLTLLVLAAAVLTVPRQAAARQPLPTPQPPLARRLASAALDATGLRLLVAETAPQSQRSTLYLIDPVDPAQKQPLAEITHRAGYPPRGQVSPDGKWVSILVIPPGASDLSARTDGGELWLASSTGASLVRVAGGVGSLAGWSADGAWLAYARLSPISTPSNPQIPFRSEVFRVRPNGQENGLLFSDAQNYGVNPLGWLPDGSYLAALLDMDGVWRLAAYANGVQARAWGLPPFDLLRRMSLSPTGGEVLIEAVADGQDRLIRFDLTGARVQAQTPLAAAPMPAGQPVSPVQGVWSARGNLWIVRQPQTGRPLTSETSGPGLPPAQPDLALAEGEHLLLESWSPDENWFLYRRYPRNYDSAYLQQRDGSALIALQPEQPGNWLTLFGWVPAGDGQ